MSLLRKRLSPLVIVVVIVVALAIAAGALLLLTHRLAASPDNSGARPVANDPYATQITGPPTKAGAEAGIAP